MPNPEAIAAAEVVFTHPRLRGQADKAFELFGTELAQRMRARPDSMFSGTVLDTAAFYLSMVADGSTEGYGFGADRWVQALVLEMIFATDGIDEHGWITR